ncbi:hypothetical protein AKJ16_DCAP05001 [Drosera capensis]
MIFSLKKIVFDDNLTSYHGTVPCRERKLTHNSRGNVAFPSSPNPRASTPAAATLLGFRVSDPPPPPKA